jgi:HEAT repeats
VLHRTHLGCLTACLFVAATVPARAGDPDAIKQAVERGVAHLKQLQRNDGTWPHGEIGATALAGLALVECDVPANDPCIQRAADAVRDASVRLTHTYSLALSILFLDRLGDPRDVPLIESMTVRLLAGQNANGGWTYSCPDLPDSEVSRLSTLVKQRSELVAGKDLPKAGTPAKRTVNDLSKEIRQQLEVVTRQAAEDHGDDNSNTQFATLALWVARRHGMPTEPAIARLDARFRATQNEDGGWGYKAHIGSPGKGGKGGGGTGSTATMTCAGLLGLAVNYGVLGEAVLKTDPKGKDGKPARAGPDPSKDPAVRAGLQALGTAIDHPVGEHKGKGKGQPAAGARSGRFYYFVWSLERVAVAYGLQTVGGKDWYAWGSEQLLLTQDNDGGWSGEWGQGGVDTCFALLFLRRANLARDLSAALKGQVQDPGEVALKAGGVGGENLQPPKKLAIDGEEKAADAAPPSKEAPSEAARLASELTTATGDAVEKTLGKLRDGKGSEFTDALAAAIPRLAGTAKAKARDALAERMARMGSGTLKEKLRDDDLEVRRAAALACAMREDKAHLPRLVELLEDPEPPVARAAAAALRSLTGQDLGPPSDASRAEQARAVAAWKAWLDKQKK